MTGHTGLSSDRVCAIGGRIDATSDDCASYVADVRIYLCRWIFLTHVMFLLEKALLEFKREWIHEVN